MDAQFLVGVNRLLNYVKDFWLKEIGAARLSVYLVPNRTNNAVESWHRSLKLRNNS